MSNIDLLRKRNNWVGIIFAMIISFNQIVNIFIGVPLKFVFSVMGIIYILILPVLFFMNKPKFHGKLEVGVTYYLLVVIGGFMFFINMLDPHMINIMTIFFYVSIMGIFQSKNVNILTILVTLSIVAYYFITQGDYIFHSNSYLDLYFYLLTFCFVSITCMLQAKFNGTIMRDADEQRVEAIKAKEEMEKVLNQINDSIVSLKKYQEELNDTTYNVNKRSSDLVSSIEKILSSFHIQNNNAQSVQAETSRINETIDEVTNNVVEMHSYVVSTKESTTESSKWIEFLAADLEEFNNNIEGTSSIMSELNKETEEIEKILSVIADLANQTNLLALNAGIEAARAGEQGKGFAVVANEVKKLAEKTKDSSESITEVLTKIRQFAEMAASTVTSSHHSIIKNRDGMNEVRALFVNIESYLRDFSDKMEVLQDFMVNVRAMTQETSAKIEEGAVMTSKNADYLQDILHLLTVQQSEIAGITSGFDALEKKISAMSSDK